MAKISKTIYVSQSRMRSVKLMMFLLILLAICVISQPAEAETSIYIFSPDQSAVIKTGGFAGVHETYAVAGQFQLTVDSDTGVASFETVDANLADETSSVYGRSLNEIFNMTGLTGTIVDDLTIEFEGKTADDTESDVRLKLSFSKGPAHLTGQTTPPPNSADMFLYDIDAVATKKYAGGSGEPNEPYLIYTAEQMNQIGLHEEDWDKHFILINDIDLSAYNDTQFNIIGRWFWWSHPDNKAFSGVFDGNGKVIRNFTWSSVDRDMVALFAFLGRNANGPTVKNLGLENVNIRAEDGTYIGALVAHNEGGLANCYVTGYVSGENDMGGLVGRNFGEIINCHSFATVEGNNDVGGLVGSNGGNIDLSFSHSTVSGRARVGGLVGNLWESIRYSFSNSTVTGDSSVGGLVGVNNTDSMTVDCYARGSVTGTTRVGGLAGANYESEDGGPGLIQRCYSSATVRGEGEHIGIGGLVGWNSAHIISCFWDRQASGMDNMCGEGRYGVGCDDSRGKTTAEMQTTRTFFSWGQCDLEVTWTIDEGNDYPRLWWENQPGEPIPARLSGLLPGSGTEDDPYLIYTAEELNLVGLFTCDFDRYFKLMADIDLTRYVGDEFNIIGIDYRYAFTGVFDGNGKRISNFTYTYRDNIGLFGYVGGQNAEIKDLGLIDPNIDAPTADRVGALVGHLEDGTLSNCYVRGGTVLGDDYVGGLVGSNRRGSIVACYSSGAVSGNDYVGGLVGYNDEGSIVACYSNGVVSGDNRVGGLAGRNYYRGNIAMSYSTGTVSGTGGGVGGLVGSSPGSITSSFWDMDTSGQTTSRGGTGKTTAEMQDPKTFMAAGWDFVGQPDGPHDIWVEPEGGGYPVLFWQVPPDYGLPNFAGGKGEPNYPYLISTVEELNAIGHNPRLMNSHFMLIDDLDLTDLHFYAIGSLDYPYRGVFDGNGHAISHLMIEGEGYLGLFGFVGDGAEVKDLGVVDVNITGSDWSVGGLVGFNGGTVTNCFSTGTVSGDLYVGGLVGSNWLGRIATSYSSSAVSGHEHVGGLVGRNVYGNIGNCFSTDTVSGDLYVGGLVGHNSGSIATSYSTGTVSGDRTIGGLVGSTFGSIATSYSTGTVTGNEDVGGLVGSNDRYGSIATSFSTGPVLGNEDIGGLVGYNIGDLTNSYCTGTVSGDNRLGGLVGQNGNSREEIVDYHFGFIYGIIYDDGTVSNCYSTAVIVGNHSVGGLVGSHVSGSITNSFWNIQISGQTESDVGTGLATDEMQTAGTFLEVGWDFVDETENGTEDIWWILEGQDYPRLWWESLE